MEASPSPGTLLFVDDEPSILSSLRRLFRPLGYTIHVAESGARGLELLAEHSIDLVISDMRMPQMDGARFLEEVRNRWPAVMRILLTGYADVTSTVAAINRGEIYRYISKPWDDNEIVLVVQKALEYKRLQSENARLLALTQAQNAELESINASLEAKVQARTTDLRRAMELLQASNGNLKKSFLTTIKLLSGLLDLRSQLLGGHARRVAEHARTLAQRLGENEASVQSIFFAGLLHDIGKIGWSEDLLDKPWNRLTPDERGIVVKHPAVAQNLLMAIEPLRDATVIIRHHHERFDGKGYPDQLGGIAIPVGARILAVTNDYDSLLLGTLTARPLTPTEARVFLNDNRGSRYDPTVVDVFDAMLTERKQTELEELQVRIMHLHPGMVLSRDVMHPEGYLLLLAGHMLDEHLIGQLAKIEKAGGRQIPVFVRNDAVIGRDKLK
ncbi:MAG: response regulator [Zoogloeaceae bacterium]|nr:response regulator [Zoogloeaceae bacterium]